MNRQIARGAIASVVFTATSVVVAVVQLRLFVHFLPAELAGLWLLFLTIGTYMLFLDLGFSPTVGREMSFVVGSNLDTREQQEKIGELLAALSRIVRLVALSAGVLSIVVGEAFILTSRFRGSRAIQLSWAIFTFGSCMNIVAGAALAGISALGRVAAEKFIRTISIAVGLCLTVVVLYAGLGMTGLALVWLLQGCIACLLAWTNLRRSLPGVFARRSSIEVGIGKRLIIPSLKLALIQIGALLILQSANPVIAAMMGTSSILPYEAVSKMAATLMTLGLLVVNSSVPYFSMAYAGGKHDELEQLLVRNLQVGIGLIAILGTFLAVNGERIIELWLGASKFAGFQVLWVLLFMVLMEVHHVIFSTSVLAAGKVVFVPAALISGILNIVLAVALAPRFGLLGIALAVAISQLLTNNWYGPYFAIRFFRLPIRRLISEVWLPLLIFIAVELLANVLLVRLAWFSGAGWVRLGLSFIVSLCVGAGLWMVVVLRHGERLQILEMIHGNSKVTTEQA